MFLGPELQVLMLSMSPVGELRASIPLGIALFHMPWSKAFLISFIGNTLSVTIVLLYLEKATNYLSSQSDFLERLFSWLFDHTREKYEKRFHIWKDLALVSLVAIPLPFTGGWTGALCAFLFGIPHKRAIPLLSIGIFMAGLITTLCTLGIIKITL
ncbi:MAG: ligand-binding protein SH3 [Deltaproteobacteria bacterium]|nr:MAG: ligand-binding protein SH3 [Deltaproteobacteria bacterium]